MRASLPATLLLSVLLGACASSGDIPASKHISQSGALRVHPGLLGQAVPAELQSGEARPNAIASPLAQATDAAPIKMDATGLRTQRSVYFDLDNAAVKADFEPALQAHGRYLASHPAAQVRIEGNADERGPAGYNARLGQKRAENVRQAIINSGADEKQVKIKSLGESRPKLKGHDEESWAENRRADVVYEKED